MAEEEQGVQGDSSDLEGRAPSAGLCKELRGLQAAPPGLPRPKGRWGLDPPSAGGEPRRGLVRGTSQSLVVKFPRFLLKSSNRAFH